jgi:uncharacterized membrane protein YedE/YeeE
MKYILFLMLGIGFGVVLGLSEVVSWYRILEMFRFESFHMYGVIGGAVGTGVVTTFLIKKIGVKDLYGKPIEFPNKDKAVTRYVIGGTLFGMGWALVGACPAPIFFLLGNGILPIAILVVFSLLGTYLYGVLREKLPH